ncbi:MAG: RNA polymerase sigma factor [Parcubacteria group bacterium]|nr:RNA polymerase sigma factor [Parcubacteria group bacterium]
MGLLDNHDNEFIAEDKSDEEILAESVKDPRHFRVLIERYQEAFVRKAEGVLHSHEDAEDVAQETFSKIYLNAARFQVMEGASFKSWGYKILMNTSFTKYQKLKRDRGAIAPIDPEFYEALPDTLSRQFEKEEVSDYLVSILSKMPEHLRRVLELHFIDGRPQQEVAEIEGVSVGAVKTRVHRAKEAFKKIEDTMTI